MQFRPRLTNKIEEVDGWWKLIDYVRSLGGINAALQVLLPKLEHHVHKVEKIYHADGDMTILTNSTKIRTVDELIQYHELDTTKYNITPVESTYWESGAKLPDGTVITIPLHRLKVRISLRHDVQSMLNAINTYLITAKDFTGNNFETECKRVGVAAVGDLHIGADIKAILKTQEFNADVLLEYLIRCAALINSHKYSETHVIILGDIIESFTGLNHRNTWQELNLYGIDAIKAAYQLLTRFFLNNINNLSKVYIIGGNHDRISEDRELDMKGGAANMLAYMLSEKGYNVEFSPLLLSIEIDGMYYICTHGNYKISSKDSGQLLFKFGRQDMYNIMLQAHKHTREGKRALQKAVTFDEYHTVHVDDINYRRLTIAPLFTGNFYSHALGYNSTAGFTLIENGGNGKPVVHDYCL